MVVEAVGGRAKVIAGTGTNHTSHSVEMAKRAAKAGADGQLVVTPYYNKPTQAGVQAHIEAVADAADLPVMVYDIPCRAGVPIHPETMIRLADHPRIVALKDAKADFAEITQVLANTDIDVYSGDDGLTLPWMTAGAVGVVNVSAHVATRSSARWLTPHLQGNRYRPPPPFRTGPGGPRSDDPHSRGRRSQADPQEARQHPQLRRTFPPRGARRGRNRNHPRGSGGSGDGLLLSRSQS